MLSMTVKENVRLGKPSADREEIVSASRIANAHSFITQMKDGYSTKAQQNSLSGGQKQRICMA
jgi:ABC-type multidrug transport system fused ATPase/permease subunit